ncbi:MAG: chloride channel protein [Flammeovirgaceae bacterium]
MITKNRFDRIVSAFLKWRIRHIDDQQFLIILSIALGVETGFVVVVLKSTVHFIKASLEGDFLSAVVHYFHFLLPMLGIILTVLIVNRLKKGRMDKGVPSILYAIGRNSSKISGRNMWLQPLASAFTVGFGGSVGLEAPVALTGASWGSYYGRVFHMNRQQTTLLLGCGASAGIAAIFNAPVAGVLFALEVILPNISITFLIPLLIASVSGMLTSKLLMGDQVLFHFTLVRQIENSDYLFYGLLGVVSGLMAVYFIRVVGRVEAKLRSIDHLYKRIITGAVVLGVLILVLPTLYGEGYWALSYAIQGDADRILETSIWGKLPYSQWLMLGFLFVSMMLKAVATGITRAAGGIGGIFAPAMFTGGVAGFLFARLLNLVEPSLDLSEANFTLVGMAGVSCGILHSPLTKIFLIAEITNGYQLFVPLMLTAAIGFAIKLYFEPHSFYTKSLIEQGDYIVHDHDRSVLHHIRMTGLIEKDFVVVKEDAFLKDLVEAIAESNRNIFPVVDDEQRLKGIILLNDVRKLIFKPELYETEQVRYLMKKPPTVIDLHEEMEEVMDKFEKTNAWNLPVVTNGQYIGFMSKSKILSKYRIELRKQTQR